MPRRKTHEEYVRELSDKGIQAEPLEEYTTNKKPIKHLWKACGHVTKTMPQNVLKGNGCDICRRENLIEVGAVPRENRHLKASQEIDQKVLEAHGVKVKRDTKTPYITDKTKLTWLCDQGHQWEARPTNIKQGQGCPQCAKGMLKGETYTREILEEYGVEFQTQKKFANLYNKSKSYPLSYDFFIPSMDILIECQGIQHYKPIEFMGGAKKFEDQQERDRLKREYAWENGYYLLEISYKDYRKDRIKSILEDAGVLQKQPA